MKSVKNKKRERTRGSLSDCLFPHSAILWIKCMLHHCHCFYKTVMVQLFVFCVKDEKIQSVLGHFQKDFEGGVSAENLGK